MQASYFSDYLVSDTLKLILSKLELKNQRHARLVCKQWFDIINLSEFNIGALYHNELPSVVSVLSRYNKPISVSFKNLDQVEIYDVSLLTQLTNLTNLSTNIDQRRDEFLTKLTDLQSLKTHTISTDIFRSLYKLTKLSCNELETGEFDRPFTQLEDLEIIDENFSGCINDFPNLKRLSVDTITEDVLMLTRLELLHLSSTLCSEGYPITLTELNIHELLVNKQKFYAVLTNLTNLKSLHLDSDFPVKHVISKFPLLEHLDVGLIDDNEEDFLIWKQLDQLTHLKFLEASFVRFPKEQCITPLTRLLTLVISPTQDIDLDVSVFSSLVNLTALSISNDSLEDPTNIYGYTALTSLTALQRLYIDYSVKESFMNNMTDLTTLRVSLDDDFKTTEKHCFTKLTNLQELDIVRPQYVQLHSVIDGFGYLPLLTRLSLLDSTVSDEDWNSITKLTNLVKYYERQFIGHNKDRFADLTAMQHLTFLCFGKVPKSTNCDHLTNLTRIQELSAGLTFYEAKKKLLEIGDLLPLCKKPLDLFSDYY